MAGLEFACSPNGTDILRLDHSLHVCVPVLYCWCVSLPPLFFSMWVKQVYCQSCRHGVLPLSRLLGPSFVQGVIVLTAFFTTPDLVIFGPQDMDALEKETVLVDEQSAASIVSAYAAQAVYAISHPSWDGSGQWEQEQGKNGPGSPPPTGAQKIQQGEQSELWMKDQLRSGKTRALVLKEGIARQWMHEECTNFTLAKEISFGAAYFMLQFHEDQFQLSKWASLLYCSA